MEYELDTIRTAGNKEVPPGTAIGLRVGRSAGTLNVQLKLPGQESFINLGDLVIHNGAIELPVKFVFLSHVKDDRATVKAIGDRLLQDGVLTWFDEKDLLPGDDWKAKIEEGIEKSDFVIVFLSSKSCQKTGYYWKEIRLALERYEKTPEGTRYIIPLLIDQCEPPRVFRDIQWLRMWEDGWYEKLLAAIAGPRWHAPVGIP